MAKVTKRTNAKKNVRRSSKRTVVRRGASRIDPAQAAQYAITGVIGLILIVVIGYLFVSGYRTAVASSFFDLKEVQVTGNDRVATDDIRKIATVGASQTGVWRADLSAIRERIEKLPFVKTASVAAMLPSGIRVDVVEAVPVAIVKLAGGNYLIDGEGNILAQAKPGESGVPIVMRGWSEAKTEQAYNENLARLKTYKKITEEWRKNGLINDVSEINLQSTREPVAVISDSGRPIEVAFKTDEPVRSLRSAMDAVSGKGDRVKAVDAQGVAPVLQYLGY